MPRKRKEPEIVYVLRPPDEDPWVTEERLEKKLTALVQVIARQAAEEDWKKAVEAQRAAKRAAADSDDEGRKDSYSPTKTE